MLEAHGRAALGWDTVRGGLHHAGDFDTESTELEDLHRDSGVGVGRAVRFSLLSHTSCSQGMSCGLMLDNEQAGFLRDELFGFRPYALLCPISLHDTPRACDHDLCGTGRYCRDFDG